MTDNDYDIDALAQEREQLHRDHASSRPLSHDYEAVGLAGEAAFASEFSLPLDATTRPYGSARRNFHTSIGDVDVQTARKAYNLLREVDKAYPPILVLAQYDDTTRTARLVGWEYDEAMQKAPTKDFGYGIESHYKSATHLRPMSELRTLVFGDSGAPAQPRLVFGEADPSQYTKRGLHHNHGKGRV